MREFRLTFRSASEPAASTRTAQFCALDLGQKFNLRHNMPCSMRHLSFTTTETGMCCSYFRACLSSNYAEAQSGIVQEAEIEEDVRVHVRVGAWVCGCVGVWVCVGR